MGDRAGGQWWYGIQLTLQGAEQPRRMIGWASVDIQVMRTIDVKASADPSMLTTPANVQKAVPPSPPWAARYGKAQVRD